MADPRTDFFSSGAASAKAMMADPRTSFFSSGGTLPSKEAPVIYDAALFKKRVGRDPEPAELANFKQFKGVGFAGDPTQGRFTAGQASLGAAEDALSMGTGIAASVPTAVGYMAGAAGLGDSKQNARAVQSALTYRPRTEAGQAGMEGIAQVANGPVETAARVGDLLDPSGLSGDTIRDVAERAQDVAPLLGAPALARGVGRAASAGASRFINSIRDVESPAGAQQILDRAAQGSNQSMGAAAASPRLTSASPELQHAIVTAAQKNGGAINPDSLARHIEADTLPVPIRLTEGESLGDVTRISNERNSADLAEFYNKRNGALKENIQAIRDEVGPDVFSPNQVEHGETLMKAYQEKAAAADAGIDAKYQALRDANGGKFPVDVKKLLQNTEDALHEGLLYEHAPKQLAQLQSLAAKGAMTFEQFEAMRTTLARTIRSTTDGNEKAAAGVIRKQMEQLPLTGETAQLKPLADAARSAAKAQFEALDADPAYKAAVQEKVAPDDFVRRFVIGGKRDDVAKMAENLKDNDVARQTMGVATVHYLRDAAKVNPDGTGTFSQAGFNKALRGLDPKIRSLVSPNHAETLEQLGNVARYTQEQPAGHFINNSKTFVAAAAEHAAGLAEGLANKATGGIPLASMARSSLSKRARKSAVKRITAPGAGLDVLEEKP